MHLFRGDFHETKYMTFLIKDDKLLAKKYNEIQDKASNSMKKGFVNKPVQNGNYLKPKIKFYEGKIITNFDGAELPKEGYQCICLSVILIASVFRTGINYYRQVFLKEC